MAKYGKLWLISLVIVVMVLVLTGFAGANYSEDAPCPDFFYQDPLPISGWPILASADADTAWAVSLGGVIIKTDDGGDNWEYQWSELQREPDTPPLRGLDVVDSKVVWTCGDGGAVLVTSDGGENWSLKRISVPQQSTQLFGISAINDKVAWVVGEGGSVYTTNNGGNTWASVPVPTVGGDLTGVSALSDTNAWVSGDVNVVAVTTNGGGLWTRKDPALGPSSTIERINAYNNQDVYAIGNEGSFYSTGDGGGTWNFTYVGDSIDLFGMSFSDMQNGWICGTNSYGAGYMGVTSDAGASFTEVSPEQINSERNMTAIDSAGANTVWACSVDGALLRTADGGSNWDRSDTVWTRASLAGVSAIDARSAWTVGSNGTILRTFNGGMTWVTQPSHLSSDLYSIDAVDSSTAWAVGDDGAILHTMDYGTNWARQASGMDGPLTRVSAVDRSEAWACGITQTSGLALHTTDGGSTWKTAVEILGAPVFAIAALDSERVWYGTREGTKGYIYRSTDGGTNWEKSELPKPVPVQNVNGVVDIKPINSDLCLALVETVAFEDNWLYLYKSTDGGKTWNVVDDFIVVDNDLFGIATVDGEDIWTCGAEQVPYIEPTSLFHSTNGGQSWERGKNFYRTVLFGIDTADGKATWTVGYISTIQRSTCPSVFSISPDSAQNTGVVEITDIAGSMFWDGMEVWLEQDGTTIKATNVDVITPYKATCEFDLNAAPEGMYDVVTRNCSGLESTLPDAFTVTSPTTWYIPEGSTGVDAAGAFETWVLVENPNDAETTVYVTYMTPDGDVQGPQFTMAPESRRTVNVAETVPNEFSVSTKVEADKPIVAERAMYWNTSDTYRRCSHGSIGLSNLSKDWYVAEGSTGMDALGSFETWVLVQNPGDTQANVDVTFMTPDGPVDGPDLGLAPGSRQTVSVADTVPNEWSVSTFIDSDVPVAVERSTYWNASSTAFRQAASASIGASSPSREWYLAEGSTGSDADGTLETWVLLENPYDHTVRANLFYQLTWGQVSGPEVILEPFTRKTVNVADTVPNEFDVSTHVVADGPIVAERAMYWNTGTYRQAAHGSVGTMSPRKEWMIAEGSTGADGLGSFDTWVLVQNPGSTAADVEITYMTPGGPVAGPVFELPANSRRSVSIADTVPDNWSISTKVVSDVPVIAARTVYWNAVTQPWRSAQSSRGYGL